MSLQLLLRRHDSEDRRLDHRLKVFEPATLSWAGVEQRVHFLNFNRGGALLDAAIAPSSDAQVVIHW